MKALFTGLVVVLLILLGVTYFSNLDVEQTSDERTPTEERDQEETAPEPSGPDDTFSTPDDYRVHAAPDLQYRIGVPFAVDVSSPRADIVRYRYVGPNSVPNSEITDGYIVTVVAEASDATSSAAVAAQNIQSGRTTVRESPTATRLAGLDAHRYVVDSELSDKPITHYALAPGNGFVYDISVNLSPPDDTAYQNTTNQILDSFDFLSETEAEMLATRIVPIAMLDYDAVGGQYVRESTGPERGCDRVVLIEHVLAESTSAPLRASLTQLFAYDRDTVGGWQNFIANKNETLAFDRVTIENCRANVYLTGELGSLGGVCDNPRAAIQIEETALAYDTVNSVQLYLNGQATDLILDGQDTP